MIALSRFARNGSPDWSAIQARKTARKPGKAASGQLQATKFHRLLFAPALARQVLMCRVVLACALLAGRLPRVLPNNLSTQCATACDPEMRDFAVLCIKAEVLCGMCLPAPCSSLATGHTCLCTTLALHMLLNKTTVGKDRSAHVKTLLQQASMYTRNTHPDTPRCFAFPTAA